MGVLAVALAISGCNVRFDGDDEQVSHRFGSDYFGAGGNVNLTDSVDGDAFLAGGHVTTAAEVHGDLLAAGGEVMVGGGIGDDLYAAGGEVSVDAIVSGNARVAGGDVDVGPATIVNGALSMTGGRIDFDGTTHGYLQATGGRVRIDGQVRGDARVRAEELEIGPHARIDGKLIVRGPVAPDVPAGAQIAGGVDFEAADDYAHVDHHAGQARKFVHGVGSFLWVFGVFIAGTLFTLAFPAYAARAADRIGREPLRSLALGFVILICLPVLATLLLITIVGIPLALILMLLYLLLLFLGWVTVALFLGRKGLDLTRHDQPASTRMTLVALLLAVVALWLLGKLPYVGGWVTFVSLLLGIGALVWQGWPRRTPPAEGAA
jgi:hypothetical protein